MKNDFKDGFMANLPIGISVFTYGSVLGVLSSQKGVELFELVLMNIFIFAGSSQFVLVQMWDNTLDIIAMITAALLINLRYFLVGASLNPLFKQSSKKEKLKYMHFATDESWAITMQRLKTQEISPKFLLGGGVCIFATWFIGTVLGYNLGEFISNPKIFGLDFAFVAIFFALALSMYKGSSDILPWIITSLIAIISSYYIEGNFYIVIASILGSYSAVILHKRKSHE